MTVAISKAARGGRAGRRLRLDGQHLGLGRRLRGAGRAVAASCSSPRATSRSASSPRRSSTARRCSRCAATSTTRSSIVRELPEQRPGRRRQLGQPVPHRRAEDRRLRDRRRARRRAGRPLHPGRQRRQHHRLLAGLPRVPRRRASRRELPRMLGFQAAGAAPIVARPPGRAPRDDRHRDPHRQPGVVVRGDGRRGGVGRAHRGGDRRGDPRGVPVPRRRGVGLLRGGLGRVGGGAAEARRRRRARASCACSPGTG